MQILYRNENPYLAPRTEHELAVAEVWKGLLGVERVGAADNFFELGGHSLLAARMLSRINPQFSCELSLRALFDHPTLEAFAMQLTRSGAGATDESRSFATEQHALDRCS